MGNGVGIEKSPSGRRLSPITEGEEVPSVAFKVRSMNFDGLYTLHELSSEELFKGRRVALFSAPGGETPARLIDIP